jgi:hypothetical protein
MFEKLQKIKTLLSAVALVILGCRINVPPALYPRIKLS